VGCATAVVDQDPGVADPNGPSGAGATGGTASTTGGTASTTGGTASTTGGAAGAVAGNAGHAGTTGGAGTSNATALCPEPRAPAQPGAMQGNSGSFDTTEAVCFFVEGTFNTWNCSNPGGRSVSVNGTPTMCGGALPAKIDGGYYFEFGASTDGTNYTSFYWYSS